jgi:archaeal cell division control protein 6
MDSMEILDEGFRSPSLIIDENKLSKDYLPQNLHYRNDQLKSLAQNFRGVLDSQMSSNCVIITGSVGVGKTSIAKKFGQWISLRAAESKVNVRYIHVNCRRARTPFMVLLHIIKELNENIANRGFAADEFLDMIIEIIEAQRMNLILVLDEVEFVIQKGGIDLLYALSRTADDRSTNKHQIGLILIAKNTQFLSFLDESTSSSLTAPVIKVDPYSKNELFAILKDRVDECFLPNSITTDSIELIADIAANKGGDARHALEILHIAGKIADMKESKIVIPEYVRIAKENIDPTVLRDTLCELNLHKLLLLLGVVRTLKHTKLAYIHTGLAKEAYGIACEEYDVEPRKHTQVWEYIQDLEFLGIINTDKSSIGQRGTTTLISISDLSLDQLEIEVDEKLQKTLKNQS